MFDLFIPFVFIIVVVLFFYRAGRNSPEQNERKKVPVLKEVIPELRAILKQSDHKRGIQVLIEKYKKIIQQYDYYEEESREIVLENADIQKPSIQHAVVGAMIPEERVEEDKIEQSETTLADLGKSWSNWYSDNSITLLLYLGAFFIVASASIFVGFQWGEIAGIYKVIAFSLITAAFLIGGIIFNKIETVKAAGLTFIFIAAILTPFNGIAWYNFYLAEVGYSVGDVWLMTSIISITLYFFLMIYLQKKIMSYVVSLGVLSLVLSIVNVSQMQIEFYVLGGIFAAFLLLIAGYSIGVKNIKPLQVGSEPMGISAQVIMPLSLGFGLYFALGNNIFISFPTALSLFLSAIFYGLLYGIEKKIGYAVVAQVLLPSAIYIFLRTVGIEIASAFLVVQFIPVVYLYLYRYIPSKEGTFMYSANTMAAITAVGVVFANLANNDFITLTTSFALFIAGLHFVISYLTEKKTERLAVGLTLLPIALFVLLKYAGVSTLTSLLVIEIIGVLYVAASAFLKDLKEESSSIFYISFLLAVAAGVSGFLIVSRQDNNAYGFRTLFTLVASAYFLAGYAAKKNKEFFFIGSALFLVVVFYLGKFAGFSTLASLNLVQAVGISYMAFSVLIKNSYVQERSSIQLIANLAMPAMGFAVALVALSTRSTLTIPEVVFSSFMSVLFYALSYVFNRKIEYLVASEAVFLWFVGILLLWTGMSIMPVLYIIGGICGLYVAVSQLLGHGFDSESNTTLYVGILAAVALFFYSLFLSPTRGELMLLALYPAVYAGFGFLIKRTFILFGVHLIFQLLSLYIFIFNVLEIENRYEILGICYLVFTLFYYAASYLIRHHREAHLSLLSGAALNGAWALTLTFGNANVGALVAILEAALAYHFHIFMRNKYGLYLGSILMSVALYLVLNGWNIDRSLHPIAFMVLFIVKYIVFVLFKEKDFAKELRQIALVGAFISVLYFGLRSTFEMQLNESAHIASFILTGLFAFDAWFVREKYYGYFASIIGMTAYLWQVHALGVTEQQVYLLPLGIYFLVLSYFTRNEKNRDVPQGLEYGGLFILLVPLLFQSFGENGFYYSLLLGAEGMLLLFLGITFKRKLYTYIGVGALVSAVFSQTYNYVFTLPRWVSTAIAGVIFISVAFVLLIKRKDINK